MDPELAFRFGTNALFHFPEFKITFSKIFENVTSRKKLALSFGTNALLSLGSFFGLKNDPQKGQKVTLREGQFWVFFWFPPKARVQIMKKLLLPIGGCRHSFLNVDTLPAGTTVFSEFSLPCSMGSTKMSRFKTLLRFHLFRNSEMRFWVELLKIRTRIKIMMKIRKKVALFRYSPLDKTAK